MPYFNNPDNVWTTNDANPRSKFSQTSLSTQATGSWSNWAYSLAKAISSRRTDHRNTSSALAIQESTFENTKGFGWAAFESMRGMPPRISGVGLCILQIILK
jgi:hypothetical protein